jgi:translocation and assembly module TamB
MMLAIKNDPRNINIVDFKLTQMNVRSTKSRLIGAMSFGIGSPVLLVRDVDIKADPVDFDLIRTLNGKPFPVDWQGQLFGSVKGRGGPLTHFFVDDARGVWRDTHVQGAESRFSGRGELDILYPAFTAFHGFDVNVGSLDLRSIEYLYPSFPRLGGTIAGTARLDSSWLDVRFSNANVTHQDGPGEPSHLTGSGRVTYGDPFMIYDVSLNADPLSLTMLARSYPGLPFRGLVSGPIRAKGTSPDLALITTLQGSGGALSFDGRLDIDSIGGYGAHGRGNFSGLDLRQLLERAKIPVGTLSGHYDVDLVGATAADLRGRALLDIDRTVFDSVRVFPSHATVRFADGRMFVDSMQLRTSAGTVVVRGGIGLPGGPGDSSLAIVVSVDSLGGLRRYLGRYIMTPSGEVVPDSLGGRVVVSATVRGRLDSLDVQGKVNATELFIRGAEGIGLTGTFDVKNALKVPTGTVVFHGDSLRLAGVALDTLGGTLTVVDQTHANFALAAARANGPTVGARGELSTIPGGQSVRLDSLGITIGDAAWRLANPARLSIDSTRLWLDSVLVRNGDSASISLTAVVPKEGAVAAELRANHIPLKDVGELAKYSGSLSGLGDIQMQVAGTRAKPDMTATAAVTGLKTGSLPIDRITSTAGYRDGRFTGGLDVYLKGQNALRATAMIPMDLTLFEAHAPKDPVQISVRADSMDLSILELLAPKSIQNAKGRLALNVDIAGRWGPRDSLLIMLAPKGWLTVENGSLNIVPLRVSLAKVHADVRLEKDSLKIADISAINPNWRPNSSIKLSGSVTNPYASAIRSYNLTLNATDFLAMDRRTRARLSISTGTPLSLSGTGNAIALAGDVLVDHSQLYLPDPALARKQLMDIEGDTTGLYSGTRTGALLNKFGLRSVAVNVNLGDDVKLRSNEADVRLGGSLTAGMQRTLASGVRTGGREEPEYPLTIDGVLLARGGTYTLDLGLVRRDFTVTDGRVRFDGNTNPPNPDIDISAIYNVKRYKQQDIGVIVHVKGPLVPGPTIEFSSNQPYEISQSDLVSYLVTGEPGFDALAGNPASLQTVATVLAPTASSLLTSGLRQSLGSWVDIVQFQGATSADKNTTGLNSTTIGDFFAGGSLSAQTQFGPKLFFSFSAGLCQFDPRGGNAVQQRSALDAFGGKLEYRIAPDLSVQTGREPSTQARYCGSNQLLGTVGTPSQWSLSLLKSWRF